MSIYRARQITGKDVLPDGFHFVDLEDESRPEDGLTYNEAELIARYRESPSSKGETRITCGWCGAHHRSASVKKHIKWFHGHDCNINQVQAAKNARIISEAKAAERESLRQVAAAA